MERFSRKTRATVRSWLVITIVSGLVGIAYVHLLSLALEFEMRPGMWFTEGATYGTVIGGTWTAFLFALRDSRLDRAIRRLSFTAAWLVRSLMNSAIIAASLLFCRVVFSPYMLDDPDFVSAFLRDAGVGVAMFMIIMFVLQVRTLIGGRVLTNFLVGRYSKPVREERVFLFLDLAESTAMAQDLGDVETHALISRFFFDVDRVTVEHGAETHRYIGDEVVVSWPLDQAVRDATCLRCVFAVADMVAARADRYRKRFGRVPAFRVGLHGGPVVAGECGSSKQEIVYIGDTINTTARLEAEAKEMGVPFLVSDSLLARMALPDGYAVRHLGALTLRGRKEPLAVATVLRDGPSGGLAAA
ncbi:MAG: adenylate/guanylate cyclase domain-containing protein [Hyphomicrobiales bacterium]|nr:adenylate/guanylate cyclase domain-containing protein [Hyphomicrobiales bacterium]MCP5374298.1 adenylate/guanylate cyclase domain-containing protein [Hyphomicrobiales bacterium]